MKNRLFYGIAVAGVLSLLTACEPDNETRTARVEVWLTDAPGDYQEVNVDVQGVEIAMEESAQAWVSLNVRKGVYNVLKLTNGLDTLLGATEIPAGRISQIRLVLGEENSIKVNGKLSLLSTPSAQQSGLKLQVHEALTDGITYKILLDFDVARSIVQMGNGDFRLKPVIRTITQAESGAIKGLVQPRESNPAIFAIHAQDTVGTTYADATGHFLLRGVPAGTYDVVFAPARNYQVTVRTGVSVTVGAVTDLGAIEILK